MKSSLVVLFTAISVVGCAVNQEVSLSSSFDLAQAEEQLKPGTNTISGSALIRQVGGGVVTCAGGTVYLMPITPYAKEWAAYVYGSDVSGYHSTSSLGINFTNLNPQFSSSVKTVGCNAQGSFNFQNVADGNFYVFTKINWHVGSEIQGGSVMNSVSVSGGKNVEVILAPQ